jgi:hypothetical protein
MVRRPNCEKWHTPADHGDSIKFTYLGGTVSHRPWDVKLFPSSFF